MNLTDLLLMTSSVPSAEPAVYKTTIHIDYLPDQELISYCYLSCSSSFNFFSCWGDLFQKKSKAPSFQTGKG